MSRPIIIVISFSLTLILGVGLVWPKYQDLKTLEKKNEEKRAEIRGREEYLQELKKTAEILQNYQIQLAKIDSALPSVPDLPVLFDFLQKVSSQSGLVLKAVSPPTSRLSLDFEGIKETELTLLVSGNYSSFKNFLSILEKTSRLIEVESISFSGAEKETSLNFNLKIKVYSY